jgi:hypothetical protein
MTETLAPCAGLVCDTALMLSCAAMTAGVPSQSTSERF